jgi:Aspartyl protease
MAAVLIAVASLGPEAHAAGSPQPPNTWQPPGILATTDTLDLALAKLRTESADAGRPGGERIERYRVEANGAQIAVTAKVRGADYALAASVDASTVVFGRSAGERWRATASGTVHLIRVDVQGDYLDRWPVAALGFDASDCSLAGVANVPARAWVIADRPARDIPRWLYVDVASGDIVREVSREGGRTETYVFDDVRGAPGARRAYRWKVSGPGGIADVTLSNSTQSGVTAADVAVPAQGPPEFLPPVALRRLSATIDRNEAIKINVRVNGKSRRFQIDSGTPELILSDDTSRAAGHIVLGHGIAESIGVDDQVARSVPFLDVDFYLDGLLGFDFFRGRIVHVDYADGRVDVLPRDGFVPPSGAFALPTDWSEGMPVVTAQIGDTAGSRFVLDLGSQTLVLRDAFVKRAGSGAGIDFSSGREATIRYLEGPFSVKSGRVEAVRFGGVKLEGESVAVEIPNAENMDFPMDGIIGTDELQFFEWWFDADGTTTWFAPKS